MGFDIYEISVQRYVFFPNTASPFFRGDSEGFGSYVFFRTFAGDMRSAIGIVHPSYVAGIGLREVLRPLFEQTELLVYDSFEACRRDIESTSGNRPYFVHFFVEERILQHHAGFFLALPQLVYALTEGKVFSDRRFPPFNIALGEDAVYQQLLGLQKGGITRPTTIKDGRLSDREADVLRLVAQGHINKEIADMLCISISTVITHRQNITRKLGIKSVAALTVYAVMNGYVNYADITL